MNGRAEITIMGIKVPIRYLILEFDYIEWDLRSSVKDAFMTDNDSLLEILLRVHYNQFIEAKIREICHYRSYDDHIDSRLLETEEDVF